ncbi:MAG TPA: alpha/beta hydrolase [Casimicrobiaceae bacterium]|nr:alpha/beta hydrolase [Casimicrobiaceae bacterium]
MKTAQSHRVPLRGLETHVLTWGKPSAPKLFLLHGWMDVGASFQFLVDALTQAWYVVAPDLRGYGKSAWQPQGYWFPDYLADLDALLGSFAPNEPVHIVGHSLGGNIVLHYAGARPGRIRAVVSLDGFGIPVEHADQAPAKITRWLDALADLKDFATYASFDAVADRLQKSNRRLPRDKAEFLAHHWAEPGPDGRVRLVSDPRHRLPFPTVYRVEETYAVWRNIASPTLWVVGAESEIPKWLNEHPEGEGGTDSLTVVRRRMTHIRDCRLKTIADAGHMLHHDQPAAVAAAIEEFVAEIRSR